MPRHTRTRAQLLDTAAALFHRDGYHATGLNHVLAESGAPKGVLYFHFPGGKQQLATEAVALSGARLHAEFQGLLDTIPDPATAVEQLVEVLATRLEASGFTLGCPVATVALDAAADSEPIRDACDHALGSWQTALTDHLIAAGVSRDTAAPLATTLLASIEGGLLLARTRRDVQPLRTVAAHLRTLIIAAVGVTPRPPRPGD